MTCSLCWATNWLTTDNINESLHTHYRLKCDIIRGENEYGISKRLKPYAEVRR